MNLKEFSFCAERQGTLGFVGDGEIHELQPSYCAHRSCRSPARAAGFARIACAGGGLGMRAGAVENGADAIYFGLENSMRGCGRITLRKRICPA